MRARKHYLQTFAAIKAFMRQKNYPPTVDELRTLMEASQATIYLHLGLLASAGLIRRKGRVTRNIELTGLEPEISQETAAVPFSMTSWDKRHIIKAARCKSPSLRDGALPKLSKARQQELIERVVARARQRMKDEGGMLNPNEDVVSGSFGHRQFRHLTATRVG